MSSSAVHAGPFALREPIFSHRGLTLRMALPLSADELIDEHAFARDERLPYWADLWPSARALARFFIDQPQPAMGGRALELGCGATALASLALASCGLAVVATDYEQDALDIAQHNAAVNGLSMATRLFDWRKPPGDLGCFDLVVAADVMYEQRNANALADAIPALLAEGGRFVLADPGRRYLPEFQQRWRQFGGEHRDLALIIEPADDASKPPSRVRIIEFTRRT